MKPFDLEAAKAGAPVQTKDGFQVRLLCFDRKSPLPRFSIAGLVALGEDDERVRLWNKEGVCQTDPCCDLAMATVKRSRVQWVNVYKGYSAIHYSKEYADKRARDGRLACVPVTLEWEE
jgi:hypothetical protein